MATTPRVSPGVWKPDPVTGQFGIAAGTDPNLPVDTTSPAAANLQNPENQQAINAGYPNGFPSPVAAPTQTQSPSLPAPSTDAISFIRQYQRDHAASPQAVQDLFAQLQSQFGIGRWNNPQYGLSNNEIDYNNSKRKVYSEGGNSWYDPDGLSNDGGGSAGGNGGAPSMSPTTGYGVPASMPQTSSPYDAALQAAIMGLLNTPQTVDAESLRHTPQFQAEQLGGQRAEERQRAQLAERASAEGWSDSGGMDTQLQGIRTARGENEANFLGNLATSQMQDNRDRLLAGISAATQSGQFQQAQALQLELANLDAAIRRETLSQQQSQFGDSLGFNYTSLQEQANEASTRALLGL